MTPSEKTRNYHSQNQENCVNSAHNTYDEMYLFIRKANDVVWDMYTPRGCEIIDPIDEEMATFLKAQEALIAVRQSIQ